MFIELTKHVEGLPVGAVVANVQDEYYHWHDDLEIMLILEGSVTVRVGPDVYELETDEILLIDPEDIHKIEGESDDNLVLFLHLDVEELEAAYPNISYMSFVCEAFNINSTMKQEVLKDKVEWLKSYMCEIMYQKVKKQEGYLERIKKTADEIVFLLVDEFRTFKIDDGIAEKNKKDNDSRIYRILRYMYDNYSEKITLEEIAEKEFLSKHYASRLIKEYMGLNFRNLLSYIRIEEAAKLLITTDKTITQIAYDTGFSKVKYLNEYFEKWYGCKPARFREKEQNVHITRDKMKHYKSYDTEHIINLLLQYLEDVSYEYSNYENIHEVITVDVLKTGLQYKQILQNSVLVDDINKFLFIFDNEDLVKNLKEINCNKVVLTDLWFDDKNEIMIQNILGCLEGCYKANINIVIQIEELSTGNIDKLIGQLDAIKSRGYEFLFKNIKINQYQHTDNNIIDLADIIKKAIGFGFDFENIKICLDSNNDNKNRLDTANTLHCLLKNYYRENKGVYHTIGDDFGQGDSIIFSNKLKSPAYYIYFVLSYITGEILQKGEEYLIVQRDGNINALLFNCFDQEKRPTKKEMNLRIKGLNGMYRYIRYSISKKTCYDYWNDLGKPLPIKKQYCDLINAKTFPNTELKTLDVTERVELQISLDVNEISLIVLEKM